MCNVPNENLISKCLWYNSYICKLIHEEHKVRVNVNLKINFIDCFTKKKKNTLDELIFREMT